MALGSRATDIFYQLMDYNSVQKQDYLQQLEITNPALYQELLPLLDQEGSEQVAELFQFSIQKTDLNDWDFSNQIVDKYKLTTELGRGGMGVVYSAHRADDTFEQELAIKFIQPMLNNVLSKHALFEEAQLLARLNHPYIAKVFDGGRYEECIYVVMEKIHGCTLDAYLANTIPSKKQKLTLFQCICEAIEHAHQHQVLHADLKPENILIDAQHAPKLIDFNLTQKVQHHTNQEHSAILAYSADYASPEQMAGDYLTQQSDVFSLGKILTLLFPDELPHSDILTVQNKATQKKLESRYISVFELRQDITKVIEYRPLAEKKSIPFYTLRCLLRRRPLQSFLAATLIALILSFSTVLILQNQKLEQEKQIAENMMYEVTRLLFHAKGTGAAQVSVGSILELTRRRILSNPDLPTHIKQKMLLAMMTPVPKRATENSHPITTNTSYSEE
ncbi:serine/threonine protein kinase [Aliivibrio finisterrensis]|uniref:serine/threonine protein kinase n=1 Tax=Aliivibrio finisterrensis TaxID=511998 RepID=UPI001021C372|nr:serine/threonine-protein kinase [Aliivibrio finisterrensis]RYU66687.1 serine/threonine protein kinase [Aliivibrio finisterrensis]RYU69756.1 serine/threonine protein kinase [Aliivibrio finisterrensis]RYU73543.1 serine/threonine protein kinase [Aliivibrio finisterrensis]